MTRLLIAALAVLFAVLRAGPLLAFDHEHQLWTKVTKDYMSADSMLHYQKLQADVKANRDHPFPHYIAAIQAVTKKDYGGWSATEQMAFLINAYNALTVKLILDNYPVESIRKIGGILTKPWSVKFFKLLDGQAQALDPIEHEILRPTFKDYRVHAAVNCASFSCPPLRAEAFVAPRLNAQLDEQMQQWLADPKRNECDAKEGTLKLSKIFEWYADDFVNWGGGVKAVVSKHGPEACKQAAAGKGKISFLEYDWKLNEAK